MKAKAGSFESGDCIVTVEDAKDLIVEIESTVFAQFGEQIDRTIKQVLTEYKINNIKLICQDKGALDYTIIARTKVALKRGGYIE